jgi:hypothetical protein
MMMGMVSDALLMDSIVKTLGCGSLYNRTTQPLVVLTVKNFKNIIELVIPFVNKYPLHGNKALDYADFCEVANLMKDKAHLTAEGLVKIRKIKAK